MQGSLNYICIARGNTILTDYSEADGNFRSIMPDILKQISPNSTEIYNSGDQKFFIQSNDNIVYCLLCSREYQQRIGFGAIAQIKQLLETKTNYEQRNSAIAHSLDKLLKNDLKEKYQLFNSSECDKLTSLRSNVNELKNVLEKDLNLLLKRGENIEVIVKKSQNMKGVSTQLLKQSKKVKNHMWWQNKKLMIAIILVVILLIWLLSSFICGFDYKSC